jgi:hypothetical protein
MFITDCQRDRDSATAFRMAFELVGTLVGSALAGTIIAFTRVASSAECDLLESLAHTNATNITLLYNATANITDADRNREVRRTYTLRLRFTLNLAAHQTEPQ